MLNTYALHGSTFGGYMHFDMNSSLSYSGAELKYFYQDKLSHFYPILIFENYPSNSELSKCI